MLLAASLLVALQLPGLADTTRRTTATHAMAVVDSARLHAASARSPAHALAATVPGATAITIDGVPGSSPVLVVRGGAIHGVNDALIVIDGVVSRGPLSDLDVDDIDRIEVLNGPASAAAYGLGAANGVIRIFTRRGRQLPGAGTRFVARSEISTHLRPRILPVNLHGVAGADGIHDDPYPVTYDAPSALLQQRVVLANHVSVQQLDRAMWWADSSHRCATSATRGCCRSSRASTRRRFD
jgi:TonB-dependent SusC/RagA subfamily outer membrane receptor